MLLSTTYFAQNMALVRSEYAPLTVVIWPPLDRMVAIPLTALSPYLLLPLLLVSICYLLRELDYTRLVA